MSPSTVVGLRGAALSYFFSLLLSELSRPSVVVLPNAKEAERFSKELAFFLSVPDDVTDFSSIRLQEFPAYDISPLTGLSPHRDIVTRRLRSLYALFYGTKPVIVTSPEALFFQTLPKEALVKSLEYLEVGEELDREAFLRRLNACGYQRAALVEETGDYAVRGGVLDVFSPLYAHPVRIEFWGDRIESIRRFDPLSQRSLENLRDAVLLPASETIMDESSIRRARSMGRLPRQQGYGTGFPGQEAWLNHFYPRLDTLLSYVPEGGLVTLVDGYRLEHEYRSIAERFSRDVERFRKEASEKGEPFPETDGLLAQLALVLDRLKRYQQLHFSPLDLSGDQVPGCLIRIEGHFELDEDLEVHLAGKGRVSMAPLAQKISAWLASRATVVLVSRTDHQAHRLREILENYEVPVSQMAQSWREIDSKAGLVICLGRLSRGFMWTDLGLNVVSEDEIYGPKRARPRSRAGREPSPLAASQLSLLKVGDFVVHEDHGIGLYRGLKKMEVGERINDFVMIEYAGGDRLYIPADRVSILQKYIGANDGDPKLDQLGGRSWDIVKKKARKSVREIAKHLVELYAIRKFRQGHAFSSPDNYYREFEATFEHEETPDQSRAIEDVLKDMGSERPMDRLICGDVGFGKTEIAVRAAFKAVSDGKQVALLVPTTVLAEQHHDTFKKRMAPYPLRIGILSRFKSPSEQNEILAKLRSGEIDILIGTHRILQKDVRFRDLGLLIIDEEQRFGVKQKEALKRFRALVDVLALTATPIPRTFQMSLMGLRDLSIIETPPEDRLAIHSYLSSYDDTLIARAIGFEKERSGQVFFVHNRVQDIDHVAARLKKLAPDARFAVAHGQMRERDLEKTMMQFLRKEIDVLVCSTIIESGLDIPSANTIIIDEVDRLGLSQIYQLRGRVGRSKEKAYAYLLLSKNAELTRDAEKRLKALLDFSHLGAGIHLAMHDLKIRGGGNILGFAQSGQISAVGYELYTKLIEQAIAELKGEDWHEEVNPEINMEISAYLPEDYVKDADVRLNLYRRLSSLREEKDLRAMEEEIRDRFGEPPQAVHNLLGVMAIRLILKKTGISRLDGGHGQVVLTFPPEAKVDVERILSLVNRRPKVYQFVSHNKLRIRLDDGATGPDLRAIRSALTVMDSA